MTRRFGRYEVVEPLGRGGMGMVWRGRDPMLDRAVAVKELHPSRELSEAQRAEYRERFFREARAAARLQHPSIVQVYDMGLTAEDCPYLVMELVDGSSLEAALKAGEEFAPEEVARIGECLARALDIAHASGIVHRDVKPANVMRSADGAVKLMDFGIARLDDSSLTAEGHFLGSPQYSAPEQVKGLAPDRRADLFSLGLLLYILLTRKNPFQRADMQNTVRAIVQDPVAPPSALRQGLDLRWDALLKKALDKEPGKRFQDARSLARALGELRAPAPPPRAVTERVDSPAPPPGTLEIVVIEGPATGQHLVLDRPVEIGREAGDLAVRDPTVSSRHCRIEPAAGRVRVIDHGSTNGTWLAGSKVSGVELEPGTVLTLGKGTRISIDRVGRVEPATLGVTPHHDTVFEGEPARSATVRVRPLTDLPRFTLVVRTGPLAGARFPVSRNLVIGRDDGDVVLGDEKVSRKHAMLELRSATRILLRDLASSNGTWMGSERVREVELKPGDEFRVGSTVLSFEADKPA